MMILLEISNHNDYFPEKKDKFQNQDLEEPFLVKKQLMIL